MSKKILICDDDLAIAKTVAAKVKSAGYEVAFAVDGLQSISVAHKEKPDLILLDIQMPGGNGDFVYEKLKLSADTKHIPIILFSGLSISELKQKADKLNAADFITKPYDPNDLIQKIQNTLAGN